MSTYATALVGAGSTVSPGTVGDAGAFGKLLKGRLVRFFRRLPEYFEHVDPIDYRHPPVPY